MLATNAFGYNQDPVQTRAATLFAFYDVLEPRPKMKATNKQASVWLRQQAAAARRDDLVVLWIGLATVALGVLQAGAAAALLAASLAPGNTSTFLAGGVALGTYAVAGLARIGLVLYGERAAVRAGAQARRRIRDDAMQRLLGAGPALLRSRHSGELAADLVDRVEALEPYFARYVPATWLAVAGPVLVILVTLWVDRLAAGVLTVAGLAVPFLMAIAGIGAGRAASRQFVAMSRLQSRFLDRVRGIATLVLLGRAEDEAEALAVAADDLRRRTMRVLRVAFLSSAGMDAMMALVLVVFALHYGLALLYSQQAAASPLLAKGLFVLLLVPEFFAPLRAYAAAYQDQLQARAAAEALCDLPALPEAPVAAPSRTINARSLTVAFEAVTFAWDEARGPALDKVTFRAQAGETLLIAGPSGAGKSTIFEILLGFVRPQGGRVLLNGIDITTVMPQALSRMTAWIGQRPLLFAGTLRENIRFARPEATDFELEEAAQRARVSSFAETLPQGLDTYIGEGGHGLSGGQAQRVAIARAFLKNAPLLLLDEPTAHLDPATEAEVLDSLRRLAIGRTVIVATHTAAAHGLAGRRIDLRQGRVVDPAVAKGAA
jgi:ATP-binding cassette subfamily C protein CydD